MKFPTIEEMAQNVAEKALDEYEYKGKTLRQWIEIILATDINVATKDGTNLASLGTDCISRQDAIDDILTVSPLARLDRKWVDRWLRQLPSAQPEIIRCRECKFASGDSRICMKFDHSPIGELDFCSFAERREVNNESD